MRGSTFDQEGYQTLRCQNLLERHVAKCTVCAKSSLALLRGEEPAAEKNKAALGTHDTCDHFSLREIGASHRFTALMLKF